MKWIRVLSLSLPVIALLLIAACDSPGGGSGSRLEVGGYYSFNAAGKGYKVLKIIDLEPELIHLCYYNSVFDSRPGPEVVSSLSYGRYHPQLGAYARSSEGRTTLGRKHIAVKRSAWGDWEAEFLASGSVGPDEQQEYESWKRGDRRIWQGVPNQ